MIYAKGLDEAKGSSDIVEPRRSLRYSKDSEDEDEDEDEDEKSKLSIVQR